MAWVSAAVRRAWSIRPSMLSLTASLTCSAWERARSGRLATRSSMRISIPASSSRVRRAAEAPSSSRRAVASPASSTIWADRAMRLRASSSRASKTWLAFWPAEKAASASWSTCPRAASAFWFDARRVASAAFERASMDARVWDSRRSRSWAAVPATAARACWVDCPNSSRSARATSANSRNWAAASWISEARASPPLMAESRMSAAESRAWPPTSARRARWASAWTARPSCSARRDWATAIRPLRRVSRVRSTPLTWSERLAPAPSRRPAWSPTASAALRAASASRPAASVKSVDLAVREASASRSWVSARSETSLTRRACRAMASETAVVRASRPEASPSRRSRSRPSPVARVSADPPASRAAASRRPDSASRAARRSSSFLEARFAVCPALAISASSPVAISPARIPAATAGATISSARRAARSLSPRSRRASTQSRAATQTRPAGPRAIPPRTRRTKGS